jgi:hypothetical protein
MHCIRTRLIRRLALGLAVAAVAAPSASAMGHGELHLQQGTGLGAGVAYPFNPYAVDTVVGPNDHLTVTEAPVELPAIEVGPGGYLTAKRSPTAEAPASYPIGAPRATPQAVSEPVAAPVSDEGFDWRIGVASGLGVLCAMVLGGALLFGRRRGTLQGA